MSNVLLTEARKTRSTDFCVCLLANIADVQLSLIFLYIYNRCYHRSTIVYVLFYPVIRYWNFCCLSFWMDKSIVRTLSENIRAVTFWPIHLFPLESWRSHKFCVIYVKFDDQILWNFSLIVFEQTLPSDIVKKYQLWKGHYFFPTHFYIFEKRSKASRLLKKVCVYRSCTIIADGLKLNKTQHNFIKICVLVLSFSSCVAITWIDKLKWGLKWINSMANSSYPSAHSSDSLVALV